MPTITAAKVAKSGPANGRLEFEIEAVVDSDDANPITWTFNVSDNKHCIGSYKLGGSTPSAAPVGVPNTLVNLSTSMFAVAFADYGRQMVTKLIGKNPANFDPSAVTSRIETKGIAFISDRDSLSDDVHCYPVHISDARTPCSVEFSTDEFNHLKTITKYLYRHAAGKLSSQVSTARTAWNAMRGFFDALEGADNEMLTAEEITMLDVRLGGGAGPSSLSNAVKADDTAIKSKTGRDRNKAATPGFFRSTG